MIFFTIASANFLAYANVLRASVRKYHPDSQFYTVLCDSPQLREELELGDNYVTIDELDLPNSRDMVDRYNISEMNTALKPFAFIHLLLKHQGARVVYLDPDVSLYSTLSELEEDADSSCILTPHLLEPAEYNSDVGERTMLNCGIFNLGFCSFRATETSLRVLYWWARRLEVDCRVALAEGLFVDQKWADLFPAYIPDLRILRHPGYNVAYWNLRQRPLEEADGTWSAGGAPLRFFHFSGNRIEDSSIFSRHDTLFTPTNTPALRKLLDEYRARIRASGHDRYLSLPYAFERGHENAHTPLEVRMSRMQAAGSQASSV